MNRQGMEVYYFSFGFLPWIQGVCREQQRSITLTCIVFFPAGEITVPLSNKIEGILNKHWHTFASMARFSDSSFFQG